MLEASQPKDEINQIKELDEYDDEAEILDAESRPINSESYNNQFSTGPNDRVEKLKK